MLVRRTIYRDAHSYYRYGTERRRAVWMLTLAIRPAGGDHGCSLGSAARP